MTLCFIILHFVILFRVLRFDPWISMACMKELSCRIMFHCPHDNAQQYYNIEDRVGGWNPPYWPHVFVTQHAGTRGLCLLTHPSIGAVLTYERVLNKPYTVPAPSSVECKYMYSCTCTYCTQHNI